MDRKQRVKNMIALAGGEEHAEVYTEVTKVDGKKVNAHVVWKLKNLSESLDWTENM